MPKPHETTAARSRWHGIGFWRVALALAPVVLLALIGALGLRDSRRAARESARTEISAALDSVATKLDAAIAQVRSHSPAPRLYDSPPLPAEPSEAQTLYEQAVVAEPGAASRLFAELHTKYPDAAAPSGVPLLPLVKWAKLKLPRSGTTPSETIESVAREAVREHPSILTPVLLDHLDDFVHDEPEARKTLDFWRQQWLADETARTILHDNRKLLKDSDFPRWVDSTGDHYWIERDRSAGLRVVARRDLAAAAKSALDESPYHLPAYVNLSISFSGEPLLTSASGETFATAHRDELELTVNLIRPDLLYAQQRRQSLWLSVLLTLTVISAVSGIWTLHKAFDRERQLHEMKSNFVASVTHELRAPIASMRVMAENLSAGFIGTESRREEYHRLIAEECWRLSTLIENVLDLARIEQDRKTYCYAETDLPALIADAATLMRATAGQRRQSIVTELRDLDKTPVCDGLAVQRALINLLDNAIKFSPPKSEIAVTLAQTNGTAWELSVLDQGCGIPAEEREKIFERFYRCGSELRRETPGAGIGLSIVRHIAENHGGQVHVENPERGGSRFTLSLPFHPPNSTQENHG